MITVWNSSVPQDRCALRTGTPDDFKQTRSGALMTVQTHNIQSINMITVWNSSVPRDRCALRTGAPDDLLIKISKRSDDCSDDCASIDCFSFVNTAVPNKRVIKTGSSLYPLVHRFERNKPDTSYSSSQRSAGSNRI